MFGFVLSLAVLSAMFTIISGAAYIYRRAFMRGREYMMYPVWLAVLTISVIPLRIDLPAAEAQSLPEPEPSAAIANAYTGDWGELELAEQIHSADAGRQLVIRSEKRPERLSLTRFRKFIAALAPHAETISTVVFVLWLSGAVISFARAMSAYYEAKRLMLCGSGECSDPRLISLLDECKRDMRLSRNVRLRLFDSGAICSPCVCGCVRPILYLDPACTQFSDDELRCVLSHELNHIRRGDMLFKLFSLAVCSIHWVNPASRLVQRTAYEDCELACDRSVIRIYGRQISGVYMNTILDFAERFSANSRIIGANGLIGGLFMSQPSGLGMMKRRYANMKNIRKNRFAAVMTAVFCAACAALSTFALSSCSDITPGFMSKAMELSEPVDQMIRAYYGLSQDDFITPEMVDGITSLRIKANTTYEGHIFADFTVNGEEGYAQALPRLVMKNYWDSTIAPELEIALNSQSDADYGGRNGFNMAMKLYAFYCLKDLSAPELTERAVMEMNTLFPMLEDKGALYIFDPYASAREINALFDIYYTLGLADQWEVDSCEFDASSLAYFTNLEEVEFVGFTPVNYSFPISIKVTLSDSEGNIITDGELDRYITERETYSYAVPTDGSTVTIPVNASLEGALREYFVMESWTFEKLPLTSRHMEKITSIKAEIDDELTAILHEYAEEALDSCRYIRYTINDYTLDVIPTYYPKSDYDCLFGGVVGDEALLGLIEDSYEYSEEYGCYVLRDDVSEEDKLTIFRGIVSNEMNKVAIVGKTESGDYLTQFMARSSHVTGIIPRFLDTAEAFDESDKELFQNLTEWDIELN